MLDLAKALLREILDALRPEIEAGTPMVGLEPSCISVFRDELLNLFPNDDDARRSAQQTLLLGDFLAQRRALDCRRRCTARCWCTATVITSRCSAWRASASCCTRSASTHGARRRLLRHGRRVWLRSRRALRRVDRVRRAAYSPEGARRGAGHASSSATASRAASRRRRRRTGKVCTSPTWCGSRCDTDRTGRPAASRVRGDAGRARPAHARAPGRCARPGRVLAAAGGYVAARVIRAAARR